MYTWSNLCYQSTTIQGSIENSIIDKTTYPRPLRNAGELYMEHGDDVRLSLKV